MFAVAATAGLASRRRMPDDKTFARTPAEEAKALGRALKRLREARGLTQDQAAEKLGVTRTAWQNYEGGRSVIMRTDLQSRLVRALDASVEDLLGMLRHEAHGHSAIGVSEAAAIYSGPGRRQAIFPLDEGDVILSFPANLSPESREQLEDHLAAFLRQRRRGGG